MLLEKFAELVEEKLAEQYGESDFDKEAMDWYMAGQLMAEGFLDKTAEDIAPEDVAPEDAAAVENAVNEVLDELNLTPEEEAALANQLVQEAEELAAEGGEEEEEEEEKTAGIKDVFSKIKAFAKTKKGKGVLGGTLATAAILEALRRKKRRARG